METGDKVLVLLLTKVACCLGLALAATGLFGGAGIWLLEGSGRWLMGGVLIALIAWLVLVRQGRAATTPEPVGRSEISSEERR